MIKTSNFLLLTLVLLVIFPSQLSMYSSDWTPLTGIGVIVFVSITMSLIILNKQNTYIIPFFILLIFIGLIFSSLITFSLNKNIKPVIVYGSLISLFFVVRILGTKILDVDKLVINIIYGASLTGLLIMFLGLKEPFSFNRYQGFFNNPNSMGMFSAGLVHMTFGILYAFNKKINQSKKIFFTLVFLLSFMFLLASNSRAAIFSVVLVFGYFILLQGFKIFSIFNLTINLNYFKSFFKYLIILCIFLIITSYFGLLEHTISKFYKTDFQGGSSGFRIDGWLFSIDNWTWFGHNNIYNLVKQKQDFGDIISIERGLGHNTWLSHLDNYGFLATFFFLIWLLFMLYWSISNIKNKKNSKSIIVFFCILLGFIGNATFETATSTPGLLVSIVLFAILYKKNQKLNLIKNA